MYFFFKKIFWCEPFLKSLYNTLQYPFCFMFWFRQKNFSSMTRDQTCTPCIESLNHWTTRKVLGPLFLFVSLIPPVEVYQFCASFQKTSSCFHWVVLLVFWCLIIFFFFFWPEVFIYLFFSFFLFFFFFLISWRLITLQYCSGFCHTLTWISHGFTCVPHPDPLSHFSLRPIPLVLPSAPGLSTCLMHPTSAGDLFHPR